MKNRTQWTRLLVLGRLAGALSVLPVCEQAQAQPPGVVPDNLDFTEIVFALRSVGEDPHWYANFGYKYATEHYPLTKGYYPGTEGRWFGHDKSSAEAGIAGPPGGGLYKLNIAGGEVEPLLEDPEGQVRDPHLHYDGRKILFSYRKGGARHFHLYEIGVDGSGLRRLTDGDADDFEPVYLPNDDIMFVSSRCNRYVACWLVPVGTLYRCDADGKNIRMISSSIVNDNTPWMLPDGRVLYMRWEYVDRNQVSFHHLWTVNPDGTGQMVFYGNMHPGTVMLDAKPIPGAGKVMAIFSPKHGKPEHWGEVTILDAKGGPDDQRRARGTNVAGRDPYPLDENRFLVAEKLELVLYEKGKRRVLYVSPKGGLEVHEPRPVRVRPREPVIPDRTDPKLSTGRMVLADAAHGRNMKGVKPGQIKKLLVLEQLPKPVNFSGAQEPLSIGGSFTLKRILGTVPVEEDGSASFEVPALRNLFFVSLDENDMSVKRMQSFVTVQPGEVVGCVGCHEERTEAGHGPPSRPLNALRRAPSKIEPLQGIPDVPDFPRDIQPILDTHCIKCHNHKERSGRVNLTGDRNEWYSESYYSLIAADQVEDGRSRYGNRPPRSIGASASPVMKKIDGSHPPSGPKVKLSRLEYDTVRLWVESGAMYPGTYAALGTGMVRVNLNEIGGVFKKRCAKCHGNINTLGRAIPPSRLHNKRPFRLRMDPFNLTHPERSLILMAPLAPSAGGLGMVRTKGGDRRVHSVFEDTSDPDYQAILGAIVGAKARLDRIGRFDEPGFQPRKEYLAELKRCGVSIPHPVKDVYALDRAYWSSFECPAPERN